LALAAARDSIAGIGRASLRTPSAERISMRLVYALALAAVPLSPLAFAGFAPAAAQEAPATQSERLHAWFEAKYEEALQFSPLALSQLGRKDRYGELDDFSLQAQDEQLAWRKATVEELERSFDYAALSAAEQLSYDLWKYAYETAAEAAKWRGNAYVFTQMQGLHTTLPSLMISIHRVDTEQDMLDYISRVGEYERVFGQLVERAQANAARGVRPPYFAYDTVIREARSLVDGAPFSSGADTALWADGKAKIAALVEAGTISEARAGELRA